MSTASNPDSRSVSWKPLSYAVTRIESGTSVNGEDRSRSNGEACVLKLSCINGGQFNPAEHKVVVASDLERVSTPVRAQTIIMSRKNTAALVGAVAYVPSDVPQLYLSDLLWQLHVDPKKADPKWLAAILSTPYARRRIGATAAGTSGSMKGISKSAILKLEFPFPDLKEQARQLGALEELGSAQAVLDDLLRAKADFKKGLAEDLLTGRRRFPGFPTPWREFTLGDLFVERVDPGRKGLRLLSVTGADGVVDRDSLVKRDTSSEDKSKYLRVCPGDIAYNTMRMWQGVFGLSTLEGIVSPAYTVCTPISELILPQFIEQFFKLPHTINDFKRYSQGLVDDTLNLKFHHFALIKVTIPGTDEQCRIAQLLGTIDTEIALLRKQRDALNDQKKGLMQKLLTGEVRLKEFR